MTCQQKILSEEYEDFILDFPMELSSLDPETVCRIRVDDMYEAVYHLREAGGNGIAYQYRYVPKLYGLMETPFPMGSPKPDNSYLTVSGIKRLQHEPLHLNGAGTILCLIDTGIDYLLPEFTDENDDTRILSIWDQSDQSGNAPEGFFYGSVYGQEALNRARKSDSPYDVVPTRDENGHGTAMALLSAGKNGAAPQAMLVVVKLKPCKQYLREFYRISRAAQAYQENDLMLAIKFGEQFAETFRRPVIFCLGLGSSMGDHAGNSFLAGYAARIGAKRSRVMLFAGGNEGNAAHHFEGNLKLSEEGSVQEAELRVGEGEGGFTLEFWGSLPDRYGITVRSPGGETIPMAGQGLTDSRVYELIYERTRILIETIFVEGNSGKELIRFRFTDPTPGIWNFRVSAIGPVYNGNFHLWLPIRQFLSGEVYFLTPSPYVTLTEPSMSENILSISGYDSENNGVYPESGRGNNADREKRPDLAAPAVRLDTGRGEVTGTSFACAIAAGAAAQFMEWAVVRKKSLLADTTQVKNYLIQGAKRNPANSYPNRENGYGMLDMQGVFDVLAGR